MLSATPQASRLRRKMVNVAEVFAKRGYIVSNDWEFPLTFYRKDQDRTKQERNRLQHAIKLRQSQIDRIEETAQTDDEVLMLVKQLQEHGDFVDPVQERIRTSVAEKTVEQDGRLKQQDEQIRLLLEQNKRISEQLERMLGDKPTPEPEQPAPEKPTAAATRAKMAKRIEQEIGQQPGA